MPWNHLDGLKIHDIVIENSSYLYFLCNSPHAFLIILLELLKINLVSPYSYFDNFINTIFPWNFLFNQLIHPLRVPIIKVFYFEQN